MPTHINTQRHANTLGWGATRSPPSNFFLTDSLKTVGFGCSSMTEQRFRIRVDLGIDGVVDLTAEGSIGNALRVAYDECRERKVQPVAVNVQQVVDTGKWEATAPVTPTNS